MVSPSSHHSKDRFPGNQLQNLDRIPTAEKSISSSLVLLVVVTIVDNVVEAELVDTLAGGHNPKPVTKKVLLEELLGPIHFSNT